MTPAMTAAPRSASRSATRLARPLSASIRAAARRSASNRTIVRNIAANPHVGVALSSASVWVSIAGTATIVDDVAKKKELWNAGAEAWLPQGPEDASVALIYVDSDSAEYWDTPGGRVASVFSFVKAKATGEAYDGAEVKKLDL